ncbi:hypothetical protein DENSPDRAFT_870783 [Dentipellis sp. KUC8613]|nr:hypothetical protein DENSPDRAFT_870783 [Dentipellis sp. KUC8613]
MPRPPTPKPQVSAASLPSPPRTSPTFYYADGDVVLRSSDGVQFRLHKLILKIASPVFDDTFSVPQPPTAETDSDIPIVDMAENEKVLRMLLGFCYPGPPPPLSSLKDVRQALAVTSKFQIDNVDDFFRQKLLDAAEDHPEQVFAIGWAHQWKDVVMAAAKATLRKPFFTGTIVDEFDNIPASAACKLLVYQRRCMKLCHMRTKSWGLWVTVEDVPRPLGVESPIKASDPKFPCSCPGSVKLCKSNTSIMYPDIVVSRRFIKLMAAISDAVEDAPHPSSVTSPAVIQNSLLSEWTCSECREGAACAVTEFTSRFAKMLNETISKIDIVTPF